MRRELCCLAVSPPLHPLDSVLARLVTIYVDVQDVFPIPLRDTRLPLRFILSPIHVVRLQKQLGHVGKTCNPSRIGSNEAARHTGFKVSVQECLLVDSSAVLLRHHEYFEIDATWHASEGAVGSRGPSTSSNALQLEATWQVLVPTQGRRVLLRVDTSVKSLSSGFYVCLRTVSPTASWEESTLTLITTS